VSKWSELTPDDLRAAGWRQTVRAEWTADFFCAPGGSGLAFSFGAAQLYEGFARFQLTPALRAKEQDHAHLRRLYVESRDYVGTLERERDALVEASRRDVAAISRLEAEVEAMKQQVGR
jgi:hypothetical protein